MACRGKSLCSKNSPTAPIACSHLLNLTTMLIKNAIKNPNECLASVFRNDESFPLILDSFLKPPLDLRHPAQLTKPIGVNSYCHSMNLICALAFGPKIAVRARQCCNARSAVICKPSRKKASLHGIQTMNGFSLMVFLSGLDHLLYVTVQSLHYPSIVVLRCKLSTTIPITKVKLPKFPEFRLLGQKPPKRA